MYQQSLDIVRQAYGDDHREYGVSMSNFAGFLLAANRQAESIPWLERADAIFANTLGDQSNSTILCRAKLGLAYHQTGNTQRGQTLLINTVAHARLAFPEGHRSMAAALKNLGKIHRDIQEYPQAEALFLEVEQMWRKLALPESNRVTEAMEERINNLLLQDKAEQAESLLLERFEELRSFGPSSTKALHQWQEKLYEFYREQGKPQEAERFKPE